MVSRRSVLGGAGAVVLVLGPGAVAAERPVLLHETGTANFATDPPATTAAGRGSLVGRYTKTGTLTLTPDPVNPLLLEATGVEVLTAANGGTMKLRVAGTFDTQTGIMTGTATMIGGTGRYRYATGA